MLDLLLSLRELGRPRHRLLVRVRRSRRWVRVWITGGLDERAGRAVERLAELPGQVVTIDLGGVTFVDSSGIRLWAQMMRRFCVGRRISYESCPPAFVEYMNRMPALAAGAEVQSVLYPCECDACDWTSTMRIAAPDFARAAELVKESCCPECGAACWPVEDPEEFFAFEREDDHA